LLIRRLRWNFTRLIQEDRFAICQFEAINVPFRSPGEGGFLEG
jgi:hypothetical protein